MAMFYSNVGLLEGHLDSECLRLAIGVLVHDRGVHLHSCEHWRGCLTVPGSYRDLRILPAIQAKYDFSIACDCYILNY